MSPEVLLIGLIAVPIILLLVLQVSAALVFLSLCLGDVLVQFTSHDAAAIFAGAGTSAKLTSSYLDLGLLLVPAALTMLFMIKTTHTKYKKIMNILPAAGVGLLSALLVVPLLPSGQAHNVMQTSTWHNIQQFESGIVALSALVCLFFLLLQRPKGSSEDKHGKKHKG